MLLLSLVSQFCLFYLVQSEEQEEGAGIRQALQVAEEAVWVDHEKVSC